jgi:hypothetical protein
MLERRAAGEGGTRRGFVAASGKIGRFGRTAKAIEFPEARSCQS